MKLNFEKIKYSFLSINRMSPRFIGIGAQKSATTSIYKALIQHPDITPAKNKELHFFDSNYNKGLHYYHSRFPIRQKGKITGECTPSYLAFIETPERIWRNYPHVKLFVCLRNPTIRAYSQWKRRCKKKRKPVLF